MLKLEPFIYLKEKLRLKEGLCLPSLTVSQAQNPGLPVPGVTWW